MKTLPRILRLILVTVVLLGAVASVTFAQDDADTSEITEIPILVPEVIATYPHDSGAYTQGLILFDGKFYESTGARPRPTLSTLREVEPETGEVTREFVVQSNNPDVEVFAEGLAKVDDKLIQLTWQNSAAIVYDFESFDIIGQFFYDGEGWGLCYDGEYLYMSNGSDAIYVRDPETFEAVNAYRVQILGGVSVARLNELECVGDKIYSNVYQSDTILEIDKTNGQVTALIDATDLLTPEQRNAILGNDAGAVLNGIAYNEEDDTFFITGKLWDTMYEVRFVPKE